MKSQFSYVTTCALWPMLLMAQTAVLQNYDFENGLTSWQMSGSSLAIDASTNTSFNRNASARISGILPAGTGTNSLRQNVLVRGGDRLRVSGFVRSHALGALGQIEARLDGPFDSVSNAVLSIGEFGWRRFEIQASTFGLSDGSFETGTLDSWNIATDHANVTIATNRAYQGRYCLHMQAQWQGWSFDQAFQVVALKAGEQVSFSGIVTFDKLLTTGDWLVAGLKIEPEAGGGGRESVVRAGTNFQSNTWYLATVDFQAPSNGNYVVRCMVAGGEHGSSEASVYFDKLKLVKSGQAPPPEEFTSTLSLGVVGFAGGPSTPVDVCFDSLTFRGSTAQPLDDESTFELLKGEAANLASRAEPIPIPDYPPLYAFGNAGAGTNISYPAYVEGVFGGYDFRSLTNRQSLRITNTIEITEFGEYGPAELQFDSFAFFAKNPNTSRGEPLLISSNAPYFRIGADNGSSAEFGNVTFPSNYTFIVGSPLSQFPARLATAGGHWPSRVNIVFDVATNYWETFTNILWNRHCLIDSIAANDLSSTNKSVFVSLAVATGTSNLFTLKTHELHVGSVAPPQGYGHPDYPVTGYAAHNRADLRKPWEFNPVDEADYYLQPAPRGNDVVDPLEIRFFENGQWIPYVHEEYLFNWPNGGSGVRSLFDDDTTLRIPGVASYHVDLKIGHKFGKNAYGDDNWPQLGSLRGNGYLRFSDYCGAFGGSFRPIAVNPFGLYGDEDFPRMPSVLCRVVPAEPDLGTGAFARLFVLAHSKTNQLLTSACRFDVHAAPEEIGVQGVFVDVESHVYLRRAHDPDIEGPIGLFNQSSMNWRSGLAIMDGSEAHDIDRVLVFRRSEGEWESFRVENPAVSVRHQSLGSLRPGDTVYLLQQDRAASSFGYTPEVPYSKASNFVIDLSEASYSGGQLPLELDTYTQHTKSEVNDNLVVSCTVRTNLQQGEHVQDRYRYRLVASPGVEIVNPSDPSGDGKWAGTHYPIKFAATGDPDLPLVADIYYGSGFDGEWVRINQQSLAVPTNTHEVVFDWDTTSVQPGAYYVKVLARRQDGSGTEGFDVSRTRLQVGSVPLLITARFLTPSILVSNGLPVYGPGEVVASEISVKNLGGTTAMASVRFLHEYGETGMWVDNSDPNHVKTNANYQRGDRLDGSPEQNSGEISIPPSATVLLTNRYILPVGRAHGDTYVLRNYPGKAQIHMSIRNGGRVVLEQSRVAEYQMVGDRRLTLSATFADRTHVVIRWPTTPGRSYQLLTSPAAGGPLSSWTTILDQTTAGDAMQYTDAITPSSRFYSVKEYTSQPQSK